MKKLIAMILVVVLCLAGCGGAEPEPTPTASLVNRVAAIESELGNLSTKVAGAPDVSAIKSDLSALSSIVEELSRQIDVLEEQIEALEEEKQEEEEEEGDVDPEDAVAVKYKATTPYVITVPAGDKRTQVVQVKMTLENELTVDLEDIEVSAEVGTVVVEGMQASDISVAIISLGGEIDFQGSGGSYDSWDTISLKAKERESYTLDLTILVTNNGDVPIEQYTNTLRITVRGECEDYEVK